MINVTDFRRGQLVNTADFMALVRKGQFEQIQLKCAIIG